MHRQTFLSVRGAGTLKAIEHRLFVETLLQSSQMATPEGEHYYLTKYFPNHFWDDGHKAGWTTFSFEYEEVHTVNERRLATLRRQLERASTALGAAGWRVRTDARGGVAVRDLIRVGTGLRADVLVLGARGTSGLRRLVLGSVAEAVLDRSPLPVLIVR